MRDLLIKLRDLVGKAVEKGLSPEQAPGQVDLPSFKGLPGVDLLKYDIEAVYKALKYK